MISPERNDDQYTAQLKKELEYIYLFRLKQVMPLEKMKEYYTERVQSQEPYSDLADSYFGDFLENIIPSIYQNTGEQAKWDKFKTTTKGNIKEKWDAYMSEYKRKLIGNGNKDFVDDLANIHKKALDNLELESKKSMFSRFFSKKGGKKRSRKTKKRRR